MKNRVTSSGTYQKIVSKGSNFIRNVGSGLQKAGKTYTSFQSYVAERRAEIRAEVIRQMCTTADRISNQLGKVDWKKVGIAVVATGAAIGVGVLTGGVGIAAVGALGLTEGTLGAAIVGGAVTGAIGGATYSGVSSGLSGNSLKQVAKDTLTGGLTGAVAGGAMGGLAYGADKAIGAVKNVIKGSSSSPKPGHITEVAKKNLADIGNKSEPQLDLGNGDPYELLKKRGIPTTLSDEERVAADAYGLVAKKQVHGNSKNSTKIQHGYEIYEKETGDVVKTGISGQKLNVNQTSPRANSQVNKWNKIEGEGKYEARIVEKDMQNRSSALEWERNNTNRLSREGNTLSHHKRPKPE